MPITAIKGKPLTPNQAEAKAPEGPGAFQTLRNWMGTGVRVGSGLLSSEGFWPGALIAGGGEALAQVIDGSFDTILSDPKNTLGRNSARIGVEAGLGAIPLGKVVSGGRRLLSAGKMGAMTGYGDVGRQWAEGNFEEDGAGWDRSRTALATGLGGVTGGVLGHFGGVMPPPKAEPPIIESSGAVPRRKKELGHGIPAGTTVPNATRTGQIHSLPSPGGAASSAKGAPAAPRVAYNIPEATPPRTRNIELENKLDNQFQDAMHAKDRRLEDREFNKLQALFESGMNAKDSRTAALAKLEDEFSEAMLRGEGAFADRMGKQRMAEDALDTQFQDAIRAKNAAMDDEEASSITLDILKDGMEAGPARLAETFSEPIPGGRRTATQVWTPKEANEGFTEVVDNAGNVTNRIEPDAPSGGALSAGGGPTGAIDKLLINLTDSVAIRVYDNLIKKGWTPRAAYKRAYEAQEFRANRAADVNAIVDNPSPQAPPWPVNPRTGNDIAPDAQGNPVPALQRLLDTQPKPKPTSSPRSEAGQALRQSTHPSFYDEGFEGLELAAPKAGQTPRPPGAPPAAAQAKLDAAAQTWPEKDLKELRRLSAIYNDPATPKAGLKEVGKLLRMLTRRVEDSLTAPKADGSKPDWVAEQTKVADELGALNPKGQRGAATIDQILPMLGGTVGGLTGAAIDGSDGDSPMEGALTGLALGAGISQAPRLAENIDFSKLRDTNIGEKLKGAWNKAPQLQRVSLLANENLPANAWAGPQGAVVMRAVEDIAKGDERGYTLLKLAYRPDKFIKGMWDSKDEAIDALIKGESNRVGIDSAGLDPNSLFDKATAVPGVTMTSGDVYARKLMKLAGYNDDEAKLATLTSEPGEKYLRRQAESGKGSWLGQMMFPFRRTLMNVIERGAERTPVVGFGMNRATGRDIGMQEALTEQAIGLGMGTAGYLAASNIENDELRRFLRAYASNSAGAYSLPSQIGWAIGDYKARGLDPSNAINERSASGMFPLPSIEPFTDAYGAVKKAAQGNIDHPADLLPDSMNFKAIRQFISGQTPLSGGMTKLFGGQLGPGWQKALDTEPERRSRGIRAIRGLRGPTQE